MVIEQLKTNTSKKRNYSVTTYIILLKTENSAGNNRSSARIMLTVFNDCVTLVITADHKRDQNGPPHRTNTFSDGLS